MAYGFGSYNVHGGQCTEGEFYFPDSTDFLRNLITASYLDLYGRYGERAGVEGYVRSWSPDGPSLYGTVYEMVRQGGFASGEAQAVAALGPHTNMKRGGCIEIIDGGERYESFGPTSCPLPVAWTSIIPSCPLKPSTQSAVGGILLTEISSNSVALNLKNYSNRLVTLKITVNNNSSWQNGFNFSASRLSDLVVNGARVQGNPYTEVTFSNNNISGTNVFYLCNMDGADYQVVFSHSSVAGARPTRTNYNLVSNTTTSTEEVTLPSGDIEVTTVYTTVRTCEAYTETYSGAWPPCPDQISIIKSGGTDSTASWCYHDGSGGSFCKQSVTVELVKIRTAVPLTGPVCISDLKNYVWINDTLRPASRGNCMSNYRDFSDKRRFRIPLQSSSLTSISSPVCTPETFRGVCGARTIRELGI